VKMPREVTVAAVMAARAVEGPAPARVLVADDEGGAVERAFAERGAALVRWRRRATGAEAEAAPWPPETEVDAAALRLPKGREALRMTLHAVLSRVRPGGALWLYGHNDEGVRSAGRTLAELADDVRTADTRRHCRVWEARRGGTVLRGRLDDWAESFEVALPEAAGSGRIRLVSFPGCFAHGRLDPGSALLLEAVPPLAEGASALDFGCGVGVVALALRRASPGARVAGCDVDALALEAARRNLPGAGLHLGPGLAALPPGARFDAIASNPPFHRGVTRDTHALEALAAGAPGFLHPGGALWLVAQRTLPLPRWLSPAFARVDCVRERGGFRVWRAEAPRRGA